LFMREA